MPRKTLQMKTYAQTLFTVLFCLSISACTGGVSVGPQDPDSQNDTNSPILINNVVETMDDDDLAGSNANLNDIDMSVAGRTESDAPVFSDFSLQVDNNRRSLIEGDEEGTVFTISAVNAAKQIIALKVSPSDRNESQEISIVIDKPVLNESNTSTTISFKLPVAMQPRMEFERRFTVTADSGSMVRTVELILDAKPINLPDVYLLIGQSNMVGRTGDNSKDSSPGGRDETHPRIRQINVPANKATSFRTAQDFSSSDNIAINPRYVRAEDPLHEPLEPKDIDGKTETTIGPGLSFAKAALSNTTQDIYLVPAAWEASGFCLTPSVGPEFAWNAKARTNSSLGNTGLLDRALVRLHITLKDTGGIFRGILWQQGESDAMDDTCAANYAENLKLMVERIRSDARVDKRGAAARGPKAAIPFLLSTQSRGIDERGDFSFWNDAKQTVDAAHRGISSQVPYSDWVNSDDLVPPAYPCGSTGCIHFGAQASREIGRRFYDALERVWRGEDR